MMVSKYNFGDLTSEEIAAKVERDRREAAAKVESDKRMKAYRECYVANADKISDILSSYKKDLNLSAYISAYEAGWKLIIFTTGEVYTSGSGYVMGNPRLTGGSWRTVNEEHPIRVELLDEGERYTLEVRDFAQSANLEKLKEALRLEPI